MPGFLAPRAYAARKRVLDSVKVWEAHAREQCPDHPQPGEQDEEYWGSNFFRFRQKMFLDMDGYDHDAIASADLGAIWAYAVLISPLDCYLLTKCRARNSMTATSWCIYELYRDPQLLVKVRAAVDSCIATQVDGLIRYDFDQLFKLPLLQSVYAETLRLRMHFYTIRMPDREEMVIRDWVVPPQKIAVTSTTVAHMDSRSWNTGPNNEHPVDSFWGERFIVYPATCMHISGNGGTATCQECVPIFSLKEDGQWIPYGGGPRQSPGRHMAKRQILLTTALMVTLFDGEIECDEEVAEDLRGFSMGVAHPARAVPVKIRRRR